MDEERAVLGAMLADSGAIEEVADFLARGDFSSERYGIVYQSLVRLYEFGKPTDLPFVVDDLREQRLLKRAGGAAEVASLTDDIPDTSNIRHYAKAVKRNALRRRLEALGHGLSEIDGDPRDELNKALATLVELSDESLDGIAEPIGDVITRVAKQSKAIKRDDVKQDVVLCYHENVDDILNGFKRGEMVVVGARPSIGKSALLINWALNIAKHAKPVLLISLEMTAKQVATRILSLESGVSYTQIENGSFRDDQLDKLDEAEERLRNLPLIINDKTDQSVAEMRTQARRAQARGGLAVMMVDYLQLAADDPQDVGQVTAVSKGLKAIAKDLKIPVLVASQLSRTIEQRDQKKPQLSDLRASGTIEQDADVVFGLWNPRGDHGSKELNVLKNRNGPMGTAWFSFVSNLTKFEERHTLSRRVEVRDE